MPVNAMNRVILHLKRTALLHEAAGRTDSDLLECYIRRRDEAAFESIVRRHGPMVLGVCRRVLRNEADAEDAFQATFLVLVRKASSIRHRGQLSNWLFGVAHNVARKARAMNRQRRSKEMEAGTARTHVAEEVWQQVQALVDDELSHLPDKYRVPIVLCDLEGKTLKEAAHHLDWPQGTVATRLARGRALLAQRLSKHGLALSAAAVATILAQNAVSACIPTPLLGATVKAATLMTAGQATAGTVSAKVAALSEGVVKAMLFAKIKSMTVVLLAVALCCGLGMVGHMTMATGQTHPAKQAEGQADTASANDKDTTLPANPTDDIASKNKAILKQLLVLQKKTVDQAANFEYPGAKRLEERNVGSIYQSLCTTTDDLSKVAEWYDKKLAGLTMGMPAGVTGDGDGTRRAVLQDGQRPDLDALAKRPVSTRSYLVRAKSDTVSVVISHPPGEALTVILLSYMPE